MTNSLLLILILLCIINIILLFIRTKKTEDSTNKDLKELVSKDIMRLESQMKDEFSRNRLEFSDNSKGSREEFSNSFKDLSQSIVDRILENSNTQKNQLELFSKLVDKLAQDSENSLKSINNLVSIELNKIQESLYSNSRDSRDELSKSLKSFEIGFKESTREFTEIQKQKLEELINKQSQLNSSTEERLEKVRNTVETNLKEVQETNSKKLEEMRLTVDEKLHNTLEQRLGDSFKLVSDRLDLVHQGLGEMQSLASGVGDLKKVLSNVKTRGTWGEIQLGNLLEQILTIEQYASNVSTKKGSSDRVEFAIKLPGNNGNKNEVVWLPIDAKFPIEDYQRLIEASENLDKVKVDESTKKLELRIKSEAKSIRDKYIDPPNTTDFAILFLPTEGLYADVIRIPSLLDSLQLEYRVVVAGPTTLSALLNSLQMGFRTLTVEKRSSEVWNLLGVVKTEFGKFGDILDKTHKKLQEATNNIEKASSKTRSIKKKLKKVQELPSDEEDILLLDEVDEMVEV